MEELTFGEEQTVREEPGVKVLFVDDDRLIRLTTPAILREHGYSVTDVGTVNEALGLIASAQFDVLISDLNIGYPGDGFTVVSAMRRTQPSCVTLIMTGYPGFDSALEAIRAQVDDYLIKPTPTPTLIDVIEAKLRCPGLEPEAATKRISQVLRESTFEITQRALAAMKSDPALSALPLTDEQRIEAVPRMLEDLAMILEFSERGQEPPEIVHSAKMRGFKQYRQGYTIPLLAAHVRFLEQAIYDVLHEHLRSLNLSYFMFDLKRLNNSLGIQLEHTQVAFLSVAERIEGQAHPVHS
ncbi:MAG: response regulator [Candidatus Korobacteraceae bacterium]